MTDDVRRALEDARHVLFAVARDLQTSWRQSTVDTLNGGIRAIDTALAAPASGRVDDHDKIARGIVAEMLGTSPETTSGPMVDAISAALTAAVKEEREACAKIADDHAASRCTGMSGSTENDRQTAAMRIGARSIADAIRSRESSAHLTEPTRGSNDG